MTVTIKQFDLRGQAVVAERPLKVAVGFNPRFGNRHCPRRGATVDGTKNGINAIGSERKTKPMERYEWRPVRPRKCVWLRYVVEIRPERTVEGKFLGMGIRRSSKTNHGSFSSQPAQTCGGAIDITRKHEPRSSRREEAQTSFLVIQMEPRARGRRDNLTIQSSTVLGAGEQYSNKPSSYRHP